MDINDIERVILDVMAAHGCHTAILYGSWARGQAAQKWNPVKFRSRPRNCRWIWIADFPFTNPTVFATLSLGGMLSSR